MEAEFMEQDLSRFCSSQREDFAKPWFFAGWTYYCDNTIAVRRRGAWPDAVAAPDGSDKPEKLHAYFGDAEELRMTHPALRLPRAIRDKLFMAAVPTEACKRCNGSGQEECSCCGQDTDCRDCDGAGKVDTEHPVVELAPGKWFSRVIISKFIDLPGLTLFVDTLSKTGRHYFEFYGGQGIVMEYDAASARASKIPYVALQGMAAAASWAGLAGAGNKVEGGQ